MNPLEILENIKKELEEKPKTEEQKAIDRVQYLNQILGKKVIAEPKPEKPKIKVSREKQLERTRNILNLAGDLINEKEKRHLNFKEKRLREPGQDVIVNPRNWFGKEYKEEYRSKVNSYQIKSYLEKLKDEVKKELDELYFECQTEPGIPSNNEEVVRELAIKKTMAKLNIPLERFFRR